MGKKLNADGSGQLSRAELSTIFRKGELLAALGWHDEDGDGSVSLEEFKQGFAFWSAITHEAIAGTPKKWQKFHLHGTIENLEDLPPEIARKSLAHSLKQEARVLAGVARAEL